MEKSEKSPVKTNSSVPDIVFHQLKMNKDEVMSFVDNDSEEQLGRLARTGGEILLPGVFPQKNRAAEDIAKASDTHAKKGKINVRVDIPTSDTELETLLFYGRSSSNDLKFGRKEEAERTKKLGSSDNEVTIDLLDENADAAGKRRQSQSRKADGEMETEGYRTEGALGPKKCREGGLSNNTHVSRGEDCYGCKPLNGLDDVPHSSEAQGPLLVEDKEATAEDSGAGSKRPAKANKN